MARKNGISSLRWKKPKEIAASGLSLEEYYGFEAEVRRLKRNFSLAFLKNVVYNMIDG